MAKVLGHHHISMYAKDAQVNADFYRKVLGLRLVKKSVNQDNPFMYHLFYGDRTGSPGTELTFFEIPHAGKTRRGTNDIAKIGLLVADEEALQYWKERLQQFNISYQEEILYDKQTIVSFQDPDDLELFLMVNGAAPVPEFWTSWKQSPVPERHQILGMGPVVLHVREVALTAKVLEEIFQYKAVWTTENLVVFRTESEALFSEIVVRQQAGPLTRPGRGYVHHLAVRVADDRALEEIAAKVKQAGYRMKDIVDRYYFKSIYFRDRNGIMFEVATDGPGFDRDEDLDHLGKKLALPPFLEAKRSEIEATLKPIH